MFLTGSQQCKKRVLNAQLRSLPLMACRVNRNQKHSATAPASVSSNWCSNFRCLACFRLPFVMFQTHAEVIYRSLNSSKNTQIVSIKLQAVLRHLPWQVKIPAFLYGYPHRDLNVARAMALRHAPRLSLNRYFKTLNSLRCAAQRQC